MRFQVNGPGRLVMTIGDDLVVAPFQEEIEPAVPLTRSPGDCPWSLHAVNELQPRPLVALDGNGVTTERCDRENGFLAAPGGKVGFTQNGRRGRWRGVQVVSG